MRNLIILAAGRGERLRPFTDSIPKSLIPIGNNETLLGAQLKSIKAANIPYDLTVVVGYRASQIEDYLAERLSPARYKTLYNPFYSSSNNLISLWLALKQIKGDFTEINYQNQIKKYFGKKVDIVLSDMAVNTTRNKNVDSLVTGELCLEAMNFALETLKTNGQFVTKIFMGSSFNDIITKAKKNFVKVSVYKPAASRKNSKESFIICKFLR